jgi:hypothetical protein
LTADERFIELLCADADLLRAEFDAIIATEWPDRPPVDPTSGARAERGRRQARQRRVVGAGDWPSLPAHPGGSGRVRPRSPPQATRSGAVHAEGRNVLDQPAHSALSCC